MQEIKIKLDDRDKSILEYRIFAYEGLKISISQFIYSNFEYNQEHYNRLIDTYIEKYSELQKELFIILNKYGYKNIQFKTYKFYINENILSIDWR